MAQRGTRRLTLPDPTQPCMYVIVLLEIPIVPMLRFATARLSASERCLHNKAFRKRWGATEVAKAQRKKKSDIAERQQAARADSHFHESARLALFVRNGLVVDPE